MLTLLSIRNFAIVSSLDLELKAGMTVVSGETGAGKSIMLDALGLALGKRAEADTVREGANRAEISAAFDITKLSEARPKSDGSLAIMSRKVDGRLKSDKHTEGVPGRRRSCDIAPNRSRISNLR